MGIPTPNLHWGTLQRPRRIPVHRRNLNRAIYAFHNRLHSRNGALRKEATVHASAVLDGNLCDMVMGALLEFAANEHL